MGISGQGSQISGVSSGNGVYEDEWGKVEI